MYVRQAHAQSFPYLCRRSRIGFGDNIHSPQEYRLIAAFLIKPLMHSLLMRQAHPVAASPRISNVMPGASGPCGPFFHLNARRIAQ